MDLETSIEYYKDNLGRMDLKPVNRGESSTNNQLLYTGELAILMKLIGTFSQQDFQDLRNSVKTCQLVNYPGLYTRHPEPYRFRTKDGSPNFVPVSFDEITGACFTNWCAGDIISNEHIIEHADLTNNRFCDIPNYELMDGTLNVFKLSFWKDLIAYFKEANTYESFETGLRKSVRNHPELYPIFFKHNTSTRRVYNSGCNRISSFGSNVVFLLAAFLASFKSNNISTKVLYWFRFRFLELTGTETFLTKLAKQYYNYTNENRLGEDWEMKLFSQYYTDVDHPFHEMLWRIRAGKR